MKCPCKDCITLAICRGLVCNDIMRFLLNIKQKCSLYEAYVIKRHTGTQIAIDEEHAIEAGKYLGYTLTRVGARHKRLEVIPLNVETKQDEEISEATGKDN